MDKKFKLINKEGEIYDDNYILHNDTDLFIIYEYTLFNKLYDMFRRIKINSVNIER